MKKLYFDSDIVEWNRVEYANSFDSPVPVGEILSEYFNTDEVNPDELLNFLKTIAVAPADPYWKCLDDLDNFGDWYTPNGDTVCGGPDWAIEHNLTTEPWVLLKSNTPTGE